MKNIFTHKKTTSDVDLPVARKKREFLSNCFPNGYDLIGFGDGNFYPFPPHIAKPMATLFPTLAWGIFIMLERPFKKLKILLVIKFGANFQESPDDENQNFRCERLNFL